MDIQKFYETAGLSAPPDFKHRQIKLNCGGAWVILPARTDRPIKTIEDLRPVLVELKPTAVYVSVSTYLHPELLGARGLKTAGYPQLSNCILGSDFVIDIDNSADLLLDMNRAYTYVVHKGFKEFKFVRTKRGAHIWVLDFYKKRCTMRKKPVIREYYIEHQRTLLADELQHHEVNFDYKVSVDTRRVVRLWGSLHDDGFTVCEAYSTLAAFTRDYALHHYKEAERGRRPLHYSERRIAPNENLTY